MTGGFADAKRCGSFSSVPRLFPLWPLTCFRSPLTLKAGFTIAEVRDVTKLAPAVSAILLITVLLGGCAGTPEHQAAKFLANGKAQIEKKDYARALLELKNAIHLQPKNAEAYYQLGLAYLATGDYRGAYQNVLQATELDPHHLQAQEKLAEIIGAIVSNGGDPATLQEAEKQVQSVLVAVPDSGEALNTLGLTEYFLGKPEDAIRDLESALEKSPQDVRAACSLARIKVGQKDFAGAEKILREAAAASPKSAEVQVALARVLRIEQRPSDAEAVYRQALSLDPHYGPALLDLAQLQFSLGRKEDTEKTLVALSALPDKRYRPLHAIYLFQQGKQEEAIKELQKQAEEDPKDRDAFTRLTSAYFVTKRFPDVERAVNAALAKNPKDTAALLERSKLDLITAKLTEAEADLNRTLSAEPNSSAAHYLLSKVFLARGQRLLAREQLQKAVELSPGLLAARLDLAGLLTADGGGQSAVDLLDQAPPAQKNLLAVVVARNWALFAGGDRVELRKSIDQGLTAHGKAPDLYLQDGLFKLQGKDLAGARKSLELALTGNPRQVRALDALGKSYVAEAKPSVALDTVRKYASQQPDSAPMQALLGNWLAQNNRNDEARKAYAAALAADPTLTSVRIATAYLDIREKKFDAARQTLTSVASAPGSKMQVEMALAGLEQYAGNPEPAMAHYRTVLEAEPDNVVALNNYAYDLANDTDQFDEALKYAQKVKELDPNSMTIEDTIGWALYRKGLYANAVQHLEQAVAKQPTATRKYHLSMAYVRSGDRNRGIALLLEARKMDPTLPEAAAAQALLAAQRN